MTKVQAAQALGISMRTLTRRIAAGQITCTRIGEGQYGELSFSYADLGLPEPGEPCATVAQRGQGVEINRQYEEPAGNVPARVQVVAPKEQVLNPAEGMPVEMTHDSYGNEIHGTKRTYSALGPNPPIQYAPLSTSTDHLNPINISVPTLIGTDGELVQSASDNNHPLNAGFKGAAPVKAAPDWNARRRDITQLIFADVRRGWSR